MSAAASLPFSPTPSRPAWIPPSAHPFLRNPPTRPPFPPSSPPSVPFSIASKALAKLSNWATLARQRSSVGKSRVRSTSPTFPCCPLYSSSTASVPAADDFFALLLRSVTHLTNYTFDGARADLSKVLSQTPAFQVTHSFAAGSQGGPMGGVSAGTYNFGAVSATAKVRLRGAMDGRGERS